MLRVNETNINEHDTITDTFEKEHDILADTLSNQMELMVVKQRGALFTVSRYSLCIFIHY